MNIGKIDDEVANTSIKWLKAMTLEKLISFSEKEKLYILNVEKKKSFSKFKFFLHQLVGFFFIFLVKKLFFEDNCRKI